MEPHSRPCSPQNGTLRLPQALVWLLESCFAGPTSGRVTQTDTYLALWLNIKKSAYRLVWLLDPFVIPSDFQASTLVGMVKLTALCGIGSSLWLWSKRHGKGKDVAQSVDPQNADAVGKKPRMICTARVHGYLFHHVDALFPARV